MEANIRVPPRGEKLALVAFDALIRNHRGAMTLRSRHRFSDPIELAAMNPTDGAGSSEASPAVVARRERLRFSDFAFDRTPSGRVTCVVTLEFGPGELVTGQVAGQASPAGDTRLGAEAAIRALETFTDRAITFELVGVKVVRAFDANVVITSLIQRGDAGPDRLLGCYLADGDMVRGAALAVLNATNRVLGNFIASR